MTGIITTFPVTVHEYIPNPTGRPNHAVCTYEYGVSSDSAAKEKGKKNANANALVFIGGLGDGPHGVPYVRAIAAKLLLSSSSATDDASWSVFEARLSSAFTGYGFSSLAQDVDELEGLVRYLRKDLGKMKVVLMGHSTGCQDCVAYGLRRRRDNNKRREEEPDKEEELDVDGLILQGPVSDREAIAMTMEKGEMEESVRFALAAVERGEGADVFMPRGLLPEPFKGGSPVTAYRWWSLAGVGGDDDFFSSDLPEEKLTEIWSSQRQPILILPSGEDEYTPKHLIGGGMVNVVERWRSFCPPGIGSGLSGLIPGATHRVDDRNAQDWLAARVVGFLQGLEK
ncbi:hypothetical protein B0H63DRAFT_264899 [Podospora didyma]|uniref:Dolichol-phosphate mannosyltransferase n=1 Tax=Podospora didyma TaxID=330526 RepID=A0AAE0KEI3_9PEZI|nr:hypothetical protein B0H63DRAFT_264899 [Podospora didyma]